MKKPKMITRTLTQTTGEVVGMHTETTEVKVFESTIGGDLNEKDFLSMMKKLYEVEDFKVVAVRKLTYETLLMGMTEDDFIRHAKVLPPRKECK